jgi:hypothetical protein
MFRDELLRWRVPMLLLAALVAASAAFGMLWREGLIPVNLPDGFASSFVEHTPAGCLRAHLTDDQQRTCLDHAFLAEVRSRGTGSLVSIEALAARTPQLRIQCHVLMHDVGYAYAAGVHSFAQLPHFEPDTSRWHCATGFTHGVLIRVAAKAHTVADAHRLTAMCMLQPLRQLQGDCAHGLGHMFLRSQDGDLPAAWRMCEALGPTLAADCAAAPMHEYAENLGGVFQASTLSHIKPLKHPENECIALPLALARPCWTRVVQAFWPPARYAGIQRAVAACTAWQGDARQGCMSGASAGWSLQVKQQPRDQIVDCGRIAADLVASCFHGVVIKAEPDSTMRACGTFTGAVASECWSWFGQAFGYFDNGQVPASCTDAPTPTLRAGCDGGAIRSRTEPWGVL